MELNGILVLAAVWFVVSLISRAGRKSQTPPPRANPRPPGPTLHPVGRDPTQQEGTRLELMLREFQRALEDASGEGRPVETPGARYEQMEEGRSLEVESEARSLEDVVSRPARREVDQDDEAEKIVARRIRAAAARDTAQSPVDHAAFDERIRQQPADHTAVRGYTAQQLRDAMVWREILGPPVSLRDKSRV
jgi:hypothetical protein